MPACMISVRFCMSPLDKLSATRLQKPSVDLFIHVVIVTPCLIGGFPLRLQPGLSFSI